MPTGRVLRFVSFVGPICRLIWSKTFLSLNQEAVLDQTMSRQERSAKLGLVADLLRFGAAVSFGVVVAACERANAAGDLIIFGEPTLTPALEVLGGTRTKGGRAGVLIFKSPTPLAIARPGGHMRCDLIAGLAGHRYGVGLHLQILRTIKICDDTLPALFGCPQIRIPTRLGLKSAKMDHCHVREQALGARSLGILRLQLVRRRIVRSGIP